MEIVNKTKHTYIVRLDPGEEFIVAMQNFCLENKIQSAWLFALGATNGITLAFFDTGKKEYKTKEFQEPLEILNLSGNIALKDNKPFCHAHGMFSRADMSTIGGHIMRCVISATCEVRLEVGEGAIKREFDERTGLYLLSELS